MDARVALVGDPHDGIVAHAAIPDALKLAGEAARCDVGHEWVPSTELTVGALQAFSGVWVVPGSPYENAEAVLEAICWARTGGTPFLGTCGGFQHAVIEYARNVRGLTGANSVENDPATPFPVIGPLVCPLRGGAVGDVELTDGSIAAALYGGHRAIEQYNCGYGVAVEFGGLFDDGAMAVSGRDPDGVVRVIESGSHPFFVATLFQPERSSLKGTPHPLITGFVAAAAGAHAG